MTHQHIARLLSGPLLLVGLLAHPGASEAKPAKATLHARLLRGPARLIPQKALAQRQLRRKTTPPAPRPGKLRRVGWGSGEQLTFEASMGPLTIGRAAISVGTAKRAGGKRTLHIRGRSEPLPVFRAFYQLQEDLLTQVDLGGVMPLRSKLTARKSGRVTRTTTEHGTTRRAATRQWVKRGKAKPVLRRRRIGRHHHDPLSALLAIRSVPLRPGAKLNLQVLTGRKTYRIRANVLDPMVRRYKGKRMRCFPLSGTLERIRDDGRPWYRKRVRRFTVWVTADKRRVPLAGEVETKWGTVRVVLTSYRPPRRALKVRPMALR